MTIGSRSIRRIQSIRETSLSFRIALIGVTGCTVALTVIAGALAGEILKVSQKNRAFSLNSMTIAKGDVIQFLNDDEFIHQIYVKSDKFNVDTEEASPGDTIPVIFGVSGTFEVLCHIHPKMRMVVTVN